MTVDSARYLAAMALGSATLYEAGGGRGAMPSALRPIDPRRKLAGPALPVACAPGDNLWLHRALLRATPGDIIVCTVSGAWEHGYWGEVLTVAAMARGVAGLVIDGGVRDAERMEALGFPVFSRRLCIRGTTKNREAAGSIGDPVLFGDCVIHAGDIVVGDRDGLVVIATAEIDAVLRAAAEREAKEGVFLQRLSEGATTLELYGWD